MTIQSISEEVRRIQKKYGESDPFRLVVFLESLHCQKEYAGFQYHFSEGSFQSRVHRTQW